ncbi:MULTISPECIES: hypothetical protein [Parabacteroides]|jgi:hypothetical protein|uniref:hypothetical protein n=1 Tax=Parabacteroides TaxID=375288 RepID=UPI001C9BA0CE|nr:MULTISPECIES: hypothetical protein [Parabacteroides]MCM0712574.1 hypothetical protein [Parabacteroides sp. TA-V-105]
MKRLLLAFFLCSAFTLHGNEKTDYSNIDVAWTVSWNRFYHSGTHLFYDYISSYEKGKELSHLPTQQEVSRQYPNPCGYGTGMEDCAILTGTMLGTLVDRYEQTGDEQMKNFASLLLEGLKRCSLIPGFSGFVARGVCTEDGKSFYYNSSRDQYTHCVHGVWKYYNSSLSNDSGRKIARSILTDIADRMHKNVIAENNFDFLQADGKPCPLGICRMWNVQPHEAARLPMFYAAAWNVTQKKEYYDLYRSYINEAIDQSEKIGNNYSAYVYLQMMYSFELLSELETDSLLQKRLQKLIKRVGQLALERSLDCLKEIQKIDKAELSMLGPDWRSVKEWHTQNGYKIPRWGKYRNIWHIIREAGESALVVFMTNDFMLANDEKEILQNVVSAMDYSHLSGCGVIFHVSAYWKARKYWDI